MSPETTSSENPPHFDLRFQLSRDEFLIAHRSHLGRSLVTVRTLFLITLALGLGALQAQLFGGTDLALRVFGGLWLAIVAFIAYAYLGLPVKILRDRPALGQEQRVRVDAAGVTLGESDYLPWDRIQGLVEKKGFLFFSLKQRLPVVIPLRLFADPRERESFRELCGRSYFAKST